MNNTPADFVQLVLTCGSWQEAQRIADTLLEKHLVACVEMLEVQSKYHWQKAIEEAKEIKLIMESVAVHFDKVETEVKKLHSYETFVLQLLPVHRVSEQAALWWQTETSNDN